MGNVVIHEFTVEPAPEPARQQQEPVPKRQREGDIRELELLLQRMAARNERVRPH